MKTRESAKTTTRPQAGTNKINDMNLKKPIMTRSKIIGLFLSLTLLFITCNDDVDVQNGLKDAPKLTFTKLTVNKQDVTKEQLLQQIKEKEKEGFSIKRITISDSDFAEVKGTAPNFSLKIKKPGTFKITITLQKTGFKEVTIEATIVYVATESLTFDKLSTAKSMLSKEDILKQVKGNKDGFTLKSIAIGDSYKSFAEVQGTAPNFSLTLKKAGDFTATIVLERANYSDVTLNASFSGVPEKLTFNELTTYKATLNKQDLFKQIPEAAKVNYALKSIAIDAKYNDIAAVQGSAPNITLKLKKFGSFKADIILSKTDYLDVTLTGASFNYVSATLTFSKFKTYKKTLTKNDIFKQIQGDKTGYTLTKIAVTNANYADVNPSTYSLTLKKDGIFAVTLTLEKAGAQKTLNGQIEYRPKPTLTFDKLITPKKAISRAEIERQIKGAKNSYTLKTLAVSDSNFATADNNNFTLSLKKTGTFSVTITLQKANYFDVVLNASFEGKPENLSFDKLSTYKKNIPKADILKQVKGGSGNYTIKSIAVNQSAFATVGSDLSLTILKEGDFMANITLQKAGYFDAVINNAAFKATSAALSFSTLKTHKSTLTKSDILAKVEGDKTGYTIIKIAVTDTSYATVNPDNSLTLKKDGVFAITITLQKTGVQKVLNGQIEYRPKPALTFNKLTSSKKAVTQAEINTQIQGTKNGYTIKNIAVADSNFAIVTGTAPNLSLTLKRTGTFSVTITLGKANYFDVTLNASIEGRAENLSFNALSITYTGTPTIANSVILAQVRGAQKANYTLKSISNISDDSVAQVQGTGGGSRISLKKAGSFTAALVLERNNYFDVTIPAASFTIQKAASKTLGFQKLIIGYQKTISKAQLETRITGSNKAGYTIGRIFDVTPREIAEPTGLDLHIKKTGDFTAKMTLIHNFYNNTDVTASFTIQKGNAKNLTFNKLTIPYQETISKARLEQNLKGEKDGYTIQRIDNINPKDAAELTGTPRLSLHIKKAGDFTVRITLTHALYNNTSVNASFTIQKLPKKTLGFTKLVSSYKKLLTRKDLLEKVTGQKDGYTIKSISTISDSDIAELSGADLKIKKAGNFTATLTLEHDIYLDATLTGAEFEIKSYSFIKLVTAYKQTLTKVEIESQVQELSGYTLKAISGISDSTIAALTGSAATALHLKKAGSFTATITMKQSGKADVVIPKAEFEIQKLSAQKLRFNALIASKKYLTESDILEEVTGAKAGYTLKTISAISGAAMAELSGTGLKIKKAGRFTATLTLAHALYADATLTGAQFQIIRLPAPKLTFDKLTITYKNKKVINEQAILQQVKGTKNGYTLKNISEISGISEITGTDIAEFTGTPKAALHIKKAGRFTATLTLAHALYADVTLTGAEFTIEKIKAPTFTFNALTTSYEIDKSIGTADLLKQIPFDSESKRGYTLKSIRMPASYGFIGGLAPNLRMELIKVGSFTVDIILEKAHHEDAEITGARFSISKGTTPPDYFRFTKMVTRYAYQKVLKKATVLKQIVNAYRNGFTIKSIANISNTSIAEVTGADFDIKIKSIGTFTADIVLHSPSNFDGEVKITGAMFQIDKGVIPDFSVAKAIRKFTGVRVIKGDFLLPYFVGASERGFFALINDVYATVATGIRHHDGAVDITKKGVYTMPTTLTSSLYQGSKKLTGVVEFTDADGLSFATLKTPFDPKGKVITSADILKQIPTATAKGYTIKSISNISDAAVASVSSSGASSQIDIKKMGTFTATIVLEKSGASDETITGARFEIGKALAPTDLVFYKLVRNYTAHQKSFTFDAATLLKQIPNAASAGYKIKELTGISDASLAVVSGTKPNFQIRTLKWGKFTARMVLESERFEDLVIPVAGFEINGLPGTNFNFSKLETAYAPNKVISTADILNQISGASGAGYVLDDLFILDTSLATVSGSKPNFQIDIKKKAGTFKVNIVLRKGDYKSVIRKATIQITKINPPVTFSFPKLGQAYDGNQYRVITASDILAEISGAPSSYAYRVKSIAAISDSKVAELTGAGNVNIGIKTEGTFTAKITLESTQYKDVTIDASFDVFPLAVTFQVITYEYDPNKGKYRVTGLKTELSGIKVLKIPHKIGDKEIVRVQESAFIRNKNLTHVKMYPGIEDTGNNVFAHCTNLTSIDLPDSLTDYGASLFIDCSNLTTVSLPPGIDKIREATFVNCTSLTDITIPIKVTEIRKWAFWNCTSLTIKVLQTDPSKIKFINGSYQETTVKSESQAFDKVKAIKVPSASEAAYKAAPIWKDYAGIISGY